MELAMSLIVWSYAFSSGDSIPALYTADGGNISPPLQWECSADPASFAIICEDPDAPMGTWVHWVIYNIPGESRMLEAGIASEGELYNGTRQGVNSWGDPGYGGPAPPSGKHRYYFTIYALDDMLDLQPGATASQLRNAMDGLIIQQACIMGEYAGQ